MKNENDLDKLKNELIGHFQRHYVAQFRRTNEAHLRNHRERVLDITEILELFDPTFNIDNIMWEAHSFAMKETYGHRS